MKPEAPPEAFYEYRFLLARGYTAETALEAVRRRHSLTRRQLILLRRCIHTPDTDARVRERTLSPAELRGERLAVDGYNQLATIYAALTGNPVYRCTDGLTRDSLLSGPAPVTSHAAQLAAMLAAAIHSLEPREALIILDSQPSRSGETAAALRRHGLAAATSRSADTLLLQLSEKGYTVATSDIVVAKQAEKLADLAGYTIALTATERAVVDVNKLIEAQHKEWCSKPKL